VHSLDGRNHPITGGPKIGDARFTMLSQLLRPGQPSQIWTLTVYTYMDSYAIGGIMLQDNALPRSFAYINMDDSSSLNGTMSFSQSLQGFHVITYYHFTIHHCPISI
jgi:hypothetical protein